MKKYFYFFLLIYSFSFSQLPDISFNGTNAWSTGTGITFNTVSNLATIVGNGSSYRKTALDTALSASAPSDFYFYADVFLQNTTFNPHNIKNPQVVVRDNTNTVIYRFNIDESLQNTWFKAGIKITGYTAPSITFEFGVNGTTGTMQVKNPTLSTTEPAFTYEFPWAVPTNVATTLNVNTAQKHTFQNDLLSTNSHFVYASYQWNDAVMQNTINTYFPMTNLRFPGGTVGNYYNYSTDTFYNNTYTPNNLANIANNGYTFKYSGFKNLVVNSGASSTLMLNLTTPTPAQTKAEYQNRYNNGLPIKWLELGNELYLAGNQVGNVTDVSTYISHTQQVVTQIKSVNANAKLAVCLDKDDFTAGSWNQTLSSQTYYDAGTLHNYNATGIYFYSKYASYSMLKFYKISMDRFTKFQNMFPNKPLLLTEWGITSEVTAPYFLETLGSADAFLAIEKANQSGIVQQAGTHMLYKNDENNEATLMYYSGSNLMLTSRGKMYSKLYEVFKNSEVYDAETVSSELETGLKAVNARMVKKGTSYKVFAVNKLPVASPLNITIDGISYTGTYTIENYAADMSSSVNGVLATTNVWSTNVGTGSISLPASSISIITLTGVSLSTDHHFSEKEKIYPNPTSDLLYFANDKKYNNLSFEIYNSLGQKQSAFLVKSNVINTRYLSTGLYFLVVKNNNSTIFSTNFIKK